MKKNLKNRIIVGEVVAKSLVSCFLTHGVEPAEHVMRAVPINATGADREDRCVSG